MNAKRLLLIVSLLFIAACGAGSPSGPVQLPQTIEYAGKSVSDDYINVQTDSTIQFVVKNAAGEVISPETVTGTIIDKDGNPISDDSYGSLGISADGQYVEYTANAYFPDLVTIAGLSFEPSISASIVQPKTDGLKAAVPLSTFDLGISANLEQLRRGEYYLKDFVLDDTYDLRYPRIAPTANGKVLMLLEDLDIVEGTEILKLTSVSIENEEKSAGGGLVTTPLKTIADLSIAGINLSAYNIAAVDENSFAVYYGSIDYRDRDNPVTYGYIQFTEDGGTTWQGPMEIFRMEGSINVSVDMSYDSNGTLHLVYYSYEWVYTYNDVTETYDTTIYMNAYYMACNDHTCSSGLAISDEAQRVGDFMSLPRLAVDDRDSELKKIYAVWKSSTDGKHIYSTISEIDYTVATRSASMIQSKTIQEDRSSTPCYGAFYDDITIDASGTPVITWLDISMSDAGCETVSSMASKMARYIPDSNSVEALTTIKEYGASSDYFPMFMYMNTDFSDVAIIVWFDGPFADPDLPMKVGYTVASYLEDDLIYSFIDTINNASAPLIRELEGNNHVDIFNYDALADKAGRTYIAWQNRSTDKIALTIGTIWK